MVHSSTMPVLAASSRATRTSQRSAIGSGVEAPVSVVLIGPPCTPSHTAVELRQDRRECLDPVHARGVQQDLDMGNPFPRVRLQRLSHVVAEIAGLWPRRGTGARRPSRAVPRYGPDGKRTAASTASPNPCALV